MLLIPRFPSLKLQVACWQSALSKCDKARHVTPGVRYPVRQTEPTSARSSVPCEYVMRAHRLQPTVLWELQS